jgi:replication fork protection complex subunit Csm3/Swi3
MAVTWAFAAVTSRSMDTDINDIWDLPVETSIQHAPIDHTGSDAAPGFTSPKRASDHPLFLPSDEDEEGDGDAAATPAPAVAGSKTHDNADIDALFEGLDDMDDSVQELAPSLDLNALRREADARNSRAVRAEIAAMIPAVAATSASSTANTGGREKGGALDGLDGEGEGEDDGKKKRKPLPKLDEARLLGKNGLPQLIKDTKNFKPKGKGHEVQLSLSFLSFTLPSRPSPTPFHLSVN